MRRRRAGRGVGRRLPARAGAAAMVALVPLALAAALLAAMVPAQADPGAAMPPQGGANSVAQSDSAPQVSPGAQAGPETTAEESAEPAAGVSSPGKAQTSTADPGPIVRAARDFVTAGHLAPAADLLVRGLKQYPTSPSLHNNLGYVRELQKRDDDAVDQYAATLSVAPSNAYATARLTAIFYGASFPARLRADRLGLLPVRFAKVKVLTPEGTSRLVAVTVSTLYPAEMHATGEPLVRTVPPGAEKGETCSFNRVVHVFVQTTADPNLLVRTEDVYYPSELLSREGRDYGTLATSLAHLAGRFEAYLTAWPGAGASVQPAQAASAAGTATSAGSAGQAQGAAIAVAASESPSTSSPAAATSASRQPLRVWLCEGGPAGGERKGDDIYLYQVAALRPGEEWLRELAHELGHARLAPLEGYAQPENSLSGLVGEGWLLSALAYEAEQVEHQPWTSRACAAWLGGLWPPGALDVGAYLPAQVTDLVSQWDAKGPYGAAQPTTAAAAKLARGFLLWLQAAQGTAALAAVAASKQGTLPALTARYSDWVGALRGPLTIRAAAGRVEDSEAGGAPPGAGGAAGAGSEPASAPGAASFSAAMSDWLPFGDLAASFSREHPWRTVCYLPAGSWRVKTGAGADLVATWQPAGSKPTAAGSKAAAGDWAPRVTSQGEWGWLQLAPAEGAAGAKISAVSFTFTPAQET